MTRDPHQRHSRPRLGGTLARAGLLIVSVATACMLAGFFVARSSGVAIAGVATALALASIAMRAWLGRLPPSLATRSAVHRGRRRGPPPADGAPEDDP